MKTESKNSSKDKVNLNPPAEVTATTNQPAPTYEEIKPLLERNTCVTCHTLNINQVGPAYAEVAKHNYTPEEIVNLIHNPQPKNWPNYVIAMPPMPQVIKEEALKIAVYINSLTE